MLRVISLRVAQSIRWVSVKICNVYVTSDITRTNFAGKAGNFLEAQKKLFTERRGIASLKH